MVRFSSAFYLFSENSLLFLLSFFSFFLSKKFLIKSKFDFSSGLSRSGSIGMASSGRKLTPSLISSDTFYKPSINCLRRTETCNSVDLDFYLLRYTCGNNAFFPTTLYRMQC